MNRDTLDEELRPLSAEHAAYLAKWLRILFFWSLLTMVGRGALICERLLARIYRVYYLYLDFSIIGVTVFATIAMAWVFWKLGKESTSYDCVIFLLAVSFCVEVLLFEKGAAGPLWWGLRLLEAGAVLLNTYHRYRGHAEILERINNAQAEKWSKLWNRYIKLILVIPAVFLTIRVFSALGEILVFAALLGLAGLGILELVYLWQTVSAFRDVASERERSPVETGSP